MQMQAHTQATLQAQLEAQQAQADHGGPSIMERFKRMSPPSFKGESDPLRAESWMREIEKIFWAIRCVEDDKVTLATYMLQERADVWWSSLLRTRFEDGAVEERKKAAFQSPQRPVASGSSQVPSQHSPSGKKECPHCGRAHGDTECWKLAGKCLKCGNSEHRIKDCPRLQQGGQRRAAPAPAAAAAPATGRPRRPRAPARMKDYDAILGLDWLEEHYALVDCRGKKIVFRIPGEDEFSHPFPRNLAG
ncbi:hypothetical protein Taro_048457, partial [Colocasia esculenta]|nr:hypothetical protein [Colocasia esculenta]